MSKILAPHKEQDGWHYIRVMADGRDDDGYQMHYIPGIPAHINGNHIADYAYMRYDDPAPCCRVISSTRVEEAVETADYLKRCTSEDLEMRCWSAVYESDEGPGSASASGVWWIVFKPTRKRALPIGSPTLREAYFRYRASARGSL